MTTGVVADCSAMIDALLAPEGETTMALLGRHPLNAPALIDFEMASVLRRLNMRGVLAASAAREALDSWRMLEITRHPADQYCYQSDLLHDLSAYGVSHEALAEARDVTLLTVDLGLTRTAVRFCNGGD